VLDALRQPLEEGVVRVARAHARVTMPARFLLVAAMNPCPCGGGEMPGGCRCSDASMARYSRRLSGPLVDRFDLRIPVHLPDPGDVVSGAPGESSAVVAERVARARGRARQRGVRANAELNAAALDAMAPLTPEATALLERLLAERRLSARGLQRLRRVALTLADLADQAPPLSFDHLAAANALRTEPVGIAARLVR
jgi:magnesium chelatase family protein